MTEKKIIEILWTGGFDSTFRVLQLSMVPVTVQPYYLSDNRKSETMELNAIENISRLIMHKPATRFELLPLKYIPINERTASEEVSGAFNRIKSQHHIGSQYEWLACFALIHPGIELGVLVDPNWVKLLNKFGELKKNFNSDIGDYYVVDTEHSSGDFITLFGNYHFPLAFLKKLEMKEKYIAWGSKDIMELTWFCHTPINEEPCGKCIPCKIAIEAGLKDRFSKTALKQYWKSKVRSLINKFINRTSKYFKLDKKI